MTPVRFLDGVGYWVIDEPEEIRVFVEMVLRKEWEAELKEDGPPANDWLSDLLGRRWALEAVNVGSVRGSDYLKSARLAQRRVELRRAIGVYGDVIWPIIVWRENHFLADGYGRYSTLREMGVQRIFAYVGSKRLSGKARGATSAAERQRPHPRHG